MWVNMAAGGRYEFIRWDEGSVLIGSCGEQQHFVKGQWAVGTYKWDRDRNRPLFVRLVCYRQRRGAVHGAEPAAAANIQYLLVTLLHFLFCERRIISRKGQTACISWMLIWFVISVRNFFFFLSVLYGMLIMSFFSIIHLLIPLQAVYAGSLLSFHTGGNELTMKQNDQLSSYKLQ